MQLFARSVIVMSCCPLITPLYVLSPQSGDDVMVVVVPICAAQETAGWETLPLLCDAGTGSGHSEHLATVTQLPAPALTRDTRVVKLYTLYTEGDT